jgi:hypothetical protein
MRHSLDAVVNVSVDLMPVPDQEPILVHFFSVVPAGWLVGGVLDGVSMGLGDSAMV